MSFEHLIPVNDIASRSGRVAVLMGGRSAERDVSLTSGRFVLQALLDGGVDAFAVDVSEPLTHQLRNLKADRVFNILHGGEGEDGHVQAVLDDMEIPYVGSGVKSSALTMDKLMTKRLLLGCGIATPDFMVINQQSDCAKVLQKMDVPLIVKPVFEGSSIGMSKIEKAEQLIPAYHDAAQYGPVFVEAWINGIEFTTAWLADTVLPTIRLGTPHQFYDYDAKYQATDTRYHCPCGLEAEQQQQLDSIVAETMQVCELRDWGRVDIMQNESGEFFVIEVNTVPGMTDHSLVPMAAKQAGLSFQQLVLRLLQQTLDRGASYA